jgi:hypothetical protein
MARTVKTFIFVSTFAAALSAQVVPTPERLLGDGISVRGGWGHLAIRDDYISQEVYAGSLPYFEVNWLHSDKSSAHRLALEYRSASAIRNHNVSAQITQAVLKLDYLYSTGTFGLLGRTVASYVGPSTDFYIYSRQQNIANGGLASFNANSFAAFLSLGINSTLVLPLESSFSVEGSGSLRLLSFGGRLTDFENKNEKSVKLTSVLSGRCGDAELLLRYNLTNDLLVKAGYRFEICQSSSWDYLLSVSDNLIVVVTYGF